MIWKESEMLYEMIEYLCDMSTDDFIELYNTWFNKGIKEEDIAEWYDTTTEVGKRLDKVKSILTSHHN